jgi:hypothetical protein
MSAQNKPTAKRTRRAERIRRKAESAKRMPFQGVIVPRGMVIGHRHLAVHNLPHSAEVASVKIGAEAEAGAKS